MTNQNIELNPFSRHWALLKNSLFSKMKLSITYFVTILLIMLVMD